MSILIGAIADDFTGATDLANTLVDQGMRVVQAIGVPGNGFDIGEADAAIIALKSRTAPTDEAVDASLAALDWLRRQGAEQVIFKYCSTFDSTESGNIGPVADALSRALDSRFAFVCPAFPKNRRTIYQGHLFVGDRLLSESPMKDHPLTPMRKSDVVELMAAQSSHKTGLVTLDVVRQGSEAITERVETLVRSGMKFGVVDAICEQDLVAIGHAADGHVLVTGGSGVAMALPENFRRSGRLGRRTKPALTEIRGRSAVLAGSCSHATRGQIEHVSKKWPVLKIDAGRIAAGTDVAEESLDWFFSQPANDPALIYASADPGEVARNQKIFGAEQVGALIEQTLGRIAVGLSKGGVRRLVVAGGETSGAVVTELAIPGLKIGPEICPGVPWTETLGDRQMALALKSGNFGPPDFFEIAFEALG